MCFNNIYIYICNYLFVECLIFFEIKFCGVTHVRQTYRHMDNGYQNKRPRGTSPSSLFPLTPAHTKVSQQYLSAVWEGGYITSPTHKARSKHS